MSNHEGENKPVYKKWWFWAIVIAILVIIIGNDGFKQGVKDGMNDIQTSSNNIEVNNEKEQQESNSKLLFEWKCSDNPEEETNREIRTIAIGDNNYNGDKLEAGKYKISYTFKDYGDMGIKTTKKYNRTYNIYLLDTLETEDTKIAEGYKTVFTPDYCECYTIELKEGQYLYIEHIANQYAGNGDIRIEKI